MALFGTDTKKKTKKVAHKREATVVADTQGNLATALIAPWLSEKALIATEKGIYTFAIPKEATKKDVLLAIQKVYNVVPKKITVVNLPTKKVAMRTRRGMGSKSARRKAYVHLNAGDTIQFA